MKLTLTALVLTPALLFTTASFAASQPETCATKQNEIQKQIDEARAHNNQNRVDGLEKALRENKEHCTEAGLQAEKQKKIEEKREKVAEREQELKEAQAKGDHDKVIKKQHKLDEAKSGLKEAEAK